jgi:hypothetical protein
MPGDKELVFEYANELQGQSKQPNVMTYKLSNIQPCLDFNCNIS